MATISLVKVSLTGQSVSQSVSHSLTGYRRKQPHWLQTVTVSLVTDGHNLISYRRTQHHWLQTVTASLVTDGHSLTGYRRHGDQLPQLMVPKSPWVNLHDRCDRMSVLESLATVYHSLVTMPQSHWSNCPSLSGLNAPVSLVTMPKSQRSRCPNFKGHNAPVSVVTMPPSHWSQCPNLKGNNDSGTELRTNQR